MLIFKITYINPNTKRRIVEYWSEDMAKDLDGKIHERRAELRKLGIRCKVEKVQV